MPTIAIAPDDDGPPLVLEIPTQWTSCLITALLAALPHFLDSFLKCLSPGGGSGQFNPGHRTRCP